MSADPHRRRLLGLLAATPIAAAAGVQPASVLGRAGTMTLKIGAVDFASSALGSLGESVRSIDIPGIGAALERVHPLDASTPPELLKLVDGIGTDPARIQAQLAAEARAIAAVALVYPPEIAAFRSFGAPMRRRLYAEMLTRESARLAVAGGAGPAPEGAP